MTKITRIDHIGIAVKELDRSIEKFRDILGAELIDRTDVYINGGKVAAAHLKLGDKIIVLDSSDDPKSSITRYVSKHGEGLHHLCLEVDDLDRFTTFLENEGINISYKNTTNPIRKEIFIHPNEFCGVLLQIINYMKNGEVFDIAAITWLVGLERFEKYCISRYNELGEMLHEKGKLLGVHMDGGMREQIVVPIQKPAFGILAILAFRHWRRSRAVPRQA